MQGLQCELWALPATWILSGCSAVAGSGNLWDEIAEACGQHDETQNCNPELSQKSNGGNGSCSMSLVHLGEVPMRLPSTGSRTWKSLLPGQHACGTSLPVRNTRGLG